MQDRYWSCWESLAFQYDHESLDANAIIALDVGIFPNTTAALRLVRMLQGKQDDDLW
jgi:hypothetical protein